MYRGVEAIRLKSYLAWVPSTVCLKSFVTVLDDRITKGKSCANRFQAWQVDHERSEETFIKANYGKIIDNADVKGQYSFRVGVACKRKSLVFI